jgi:hypothetical protein
MEIRNGERKRGNKARRIKILKKKKKKMSNGRNSHESLTEGTRLPIALKCVTESPP